MVQKHLVKVLLLAVDDGPTWLPILWEEVFQAGRPNLAAHSSSDQYRTQATRADSTKYKTTQQDVGLTNTQPWQKFQMEHVTHATLVH